MWRKLADGLGFVFYLVALLLVAASIWAACANVIAFGWNSEAAAWVQAAGSIAAIVGAAWLAQGEARRARKMRREQYEEAAWYVRFAIVQAQFESQVIAAELINRDTPVEEGDARGWRQRSATVAISLNALSNRIDHIHPAVTHVISNAKILVDDLNVDIAKLSELLEKRKQPDEEMVSRIASPHRALLELIELYDSQMRGIRVALDEGNDALPIKTWALRNADNNNAPPTST